MRTIIFISVLVLTSAQLSNAQWSSNPVANTPVCVLPDSQSVPAIISDNAGGVFITWKDKRFPFNNIYAQKLNSSGVPQWSLNGVLVQNSSSQDYGPEIILDGSGGIIIVYNNGYKAAKINSNGIVQWFIGNTYLTSGLSQDITSDGSGGVIIASTGNGGSSGVDIIAQRINSSGSILWSTSGAVICNAAGFQGQPQIIGDGSGGAIIVWADSRVSQNDVYIQKINSSGVIVWTANGVPLCTAANSQYNAQLVSDGSGGAIVCWFDLRGSNADIYAQRINSSGAVLWASDGVAVCSASGQESVPQIISDGNGGAIITWQDSRNSGTYNDIYAQRINSSGITQWTVNGEVVCTYANNQVSPLIIADGAGGGIITWQDDRLFNNDIYAQKINSSGIVQWSSDGIAVCADQRNQSLPIITSDSYNGAIIAWTDIRNGTVFSTDIYCQRIQSDGSLPVSLVYFNWEPDENTVELRWGTYEELNNSGFYIERKESETGNWISAGFITGHGTTSEPQDYRFDDRQLATGQYQYRLKQMDFNGNFEYFNLQEFAVVGIPSSAKLSQNYPNPFNPVTKFDYQLTYSAKVKIKVYNTAGMEVLSLVDEVKPAGYYHLDFDGSRLASGIYFYRIIAEGLDQKFTDTKKMVLVK